MEVQLHLLTVLQPFGILRAGLLLEIGHTVCFTASLFITGEEVSEEECEEEEQEETTVHTCKDSCCGCVLVSELSGGDAGAAVRNLQSLRIILSLSV